MYVEHPVFAQPDRLDMPVWRYMDFTKLLSLLDSRCLYFPRADKLGDAFEGSLPRRNVDSRLIVPPQIPEKAAAGYIELMQNRGDFTKAWTTYCAVSCWHLSEHESAAMWNLYLSASEGVAIRSIYEDFRDSFIDEKPVYVGKVRYINYDTDVIAELNMLEPFVHKRMSFEHEREVRAVIMRMPDFGVPNSTPKPTIEHGVSVPVEVERLISEIYVSPASPEWFRGLVESAVGRYGYDFSVIRSDIDRQPLF